MSKYVKTYNLFEGFLKTLEIDTLSSNEKKLINLLRDKFDDVVDVGTFQGKRAKLLVDLIKNNGKTITDSISIKERTGKDGAFPIKKIKQMEVENFRGFGKREEFSFDKDYTVVYGPNGTGKSSFCDALEFAMLGYINEAISKRIDVDKYILNAITKKKKSPILKALDIEGKEIDLEHAPDIYEFCFIEKNRIANFARISANTPKDQQTLLSILFGLEDFNKFVMHFTDNFETYLDVEGQKKKDLDNKKKEVSDAEGTIKETKEEIVTIGKEKENLVKNFSDMSSFDEVDVFINGEQKNEEGQKGAGQHDKSEKNQEKIGRIAEITNILTQPMPSKYYVKKYEDLESDGNAIKKQIGKYQEYEQTYDKEKEKVAYKQLYEAVLDLEKISKEKCPACKTPIKNTIANPFDNAREEIKQLQYIAELEEKLNNTWTDIVNKTNSLVEDVEKTKGTSERIGCPLAVDLEEIAALAPNNRGRYIGEINKLVGQIVAQSEQVQNIHKKSTEKNNEIENLDRTRESLKKEKEKLDTVDKSITSIKTKQKMCEDRIKKAQLKIDDFEEKNKVLIKEVEVETLQIEENKKYLEAYKSIIGKLKAYNERLPLKLVEDLNELTRDFYNVINMYDREFELLSAVKMPVSSDSGIKIVFKNNEKEEYDALHVLSEGHIRCLGLAILLAKNVADNKGIVIFDDVVNAIDDDHRAGIRELLFKNDKIKEKQIILTSHAEQFIRDLDNQFKDKEYEKLVQRINFMRPSDKRSINVNDEGKNFNYLANARLSLEEENKQDCLMYCRKALENITNSFWRKLGKTYNIGVKVKMRHPKDPPDLMTVVQGLKSIIDKDSFPEKNNYKNITDSFKYLEGLEVSHKNVWSYLNKGAHDEIDREELDRVVVETVLAEMIKLNDEVK